MKILYKHKLEKEIRCSLEYGLNIFGGKWKSRIICVLADKQAIRYNALCKELYNITDTVLASTLKEMIADGIVERKQYNEVPPRVEYNLSPKGESVVPILKSICKWSGAYHRADNGNTLTMCQTCDYNVN